MRFQPPDAPEHSSNPGAKTDVAERTPSAADRDTAADAFRFAARLRGCAESLKSTCKQAEPDFLQLGNRLHAVHTDATEITQMVFAALNECGTGADGHVLSKAVAHARASLSELKADRERMIENSSSIEAVVRELMELTQAGTMLQKIARSLKVIGINIGIESARFDEAQELFAPLAAEIRSLSDEVRKTAAIVSRDTGSAIAGLSEVRNEIHGRIEQLAEWSSEAEQTLDSTLPRVEEAFRFTAQVFAQAGENAGKVSQRIGEIVVGIQIHDNISQRVDHIAEALLNAEAHCKGIRPEDGVHSAGSLQAAYSIVNLQAAQLDLLIRDVEAAYGTNKTSFSELKRIVDETSRMLCGILSAEADIGNSPSNFQSEPADASFTSIQEAFRRIHVLLGQGTETLTRIGTAMDRATESADKLSIHMGTIRNTNFDIHLKALNAIAHSLQLGARGKTFSVLVTEIKERAVESDGFVSCVEAILDKIGRELQAVGNRGRDRECIDSEASSGLLLEKAIVEFSSACELYRKNAGTLPILGAALERNITDTITHVEFLNALSSNLSRSLEDIRGVLGEMNPLVESDTVSSHPGVEKLSARYTMQKERGLHEAFLSGGVLDENYRSTGIPNEALQKPVAPPALRPGGEDPLGDNVELF